MKSKKFRAFLMETSKLVQNLGGVGAWNLTILNFLSFWNGLRYWSQTLDNFYSHVYRHYITITLNSEMVGEQIDFFWMNYNGMTQPGVYYA